MLLESKAPSVLARLLALSPSLESVLDQHDLDGELWAQGVLALKPHLLESGRFEDYGAWLDRALEVAQSDETQSWLMLQQGLLLCRQHEPEQAAALLETMAPTLRSPRLRVHHAYGLGMALIEAGHFERARVVMEEGRAVAQQHAFPRARCLFELSLGHLALSQGGYNDAISCFRNTLLLNHKQYRDKEIDKSARCGLITAMMGQRQYKATVRECLVLEKTLMSDGDVCARIVFASKRVQALLALGHWGEVLDEEERLQDLRAQCAECGPGWPRLSACKALACALGPRQQGEWLLQAHLENAQANHKANASLLALVKALIDDQPVVQEVIEHPVVRLELLEALVIRAGQHLLDLEDLNPLERTLCERFLGAGVSVHVRGDFEAVSFDGQTWVDLRRKRIGRRILQTLAGAAPKAVDAWSLFEAVWPDATVRSADDLNRLYAAIHRLKAAGLASLFDYSESGYRWVAVAVPDVSGGQT